MESDGVAVHFVLYLGEHLKEFALYIESDGLRRLAVKQFVRAVAVVFSESGNGDIKVEFAFNNSPDDVHLSFSSVSNDEIGQRLLLF